MLKRSQLYLKCEDVNHIICSHQSSKPYNDINLNYKEDQEEQIYISTIHNIDRNDLARYHFTNVKLVCAIVGALRLGYPSVVCQARGGGIKTLP
jgi:hypothetical protein